MTETRPTATDPRRYVRRSAISFAVMLALGLAALIVGIVGSRVLLVLGGVALLGLSIALAVLMLWLMRRFPEAYRPPPRD